ncbi:hypothetical protein J3D56_004221 [Erwinia persicina]|uniref:hypothetical protein n=1 Tax=Erwinia persicina TaxID=55211 RepID=UPI0020A14325|nr:hypothetical protein [Erwinia persicina]MCP1440785.1 hypothetical protein [Erwinia persicina]
MSIEWDGTGLPPVGCEFEYYAGPRWNKALMKYAGEKFAIVDIDGYGESWLRVSVIKTRPIRTEAERRRSELCDRIYGAMTKADREGNRSDMAESVYDAIAAGKIPGIRLADDTSD